MPTCTGKLCTVILVAIFSFVQFDKFELTSKRIILSNFNLTQERLPKVAPTVIFSALYLFFLEDISDFFVGPLIRLFKTSGDVYHAFQSRSGFPRLPGLSPVCNAFLRFNSGATPADLLVASMAA